MEALGLIVVAQVLLEFDLHFCSGISTDMLSGPLADDLLQKNLDLIVHDVGVVCATVIPTEGNSGHDDLRAGDG